VPPRPLAPASGAALPISKPSQSIVAAALILPPRAAWWPANCEHDRINTRRARLTFGFRRCTRCTLDNEDAGLHQTDRRDVTTVKGLGIAVVCRWVFHTSPDSYEQSAIPGSSSLQPPRIFTISDWRDRHGSRSSHCVTTDRCAGGRETPIRDSCRQFGSSTEKDLGRLTSCSSRRCGDFRRHDRSRSLAIDRGSKRIAGVVERSPCRGVENNGR